MCVRVCVGGGGGGGEGMCAQGMYIIHSGYSTACSCILQYTSVILHIQFAANFILLTSVNLVGVFFNHLAELAQRKSFSERRRYISAVIKIDEQKQKKVCVGLGPVRTDQVLLECLIGVNSFNGCQPILVHVEACV